ncbi:MAG: 4Fe-4S dicluster domain-containing protein [Gracilibacteraceae bacterium]|nr:4Fe-4S dicluster domain-containing protein [Gracilibacteraceae bacterium]
MLELRNPQGIIFLVLTIVTLALFVSALSRKLRILKLGAPENRFDNPLRRLGNFIMLIPLQGKMLREFYGVIHLFVFWGFIFIVLGEIPLLLEGIFPDLVVPLLGDNPYFYLIKDALSLLVVVGLFIGLIRRWVLKPRRLYRTSEAALVVILVLAVILTDWLVGAAKLALAEGGAVAAFRLTVGYPFFASVFLTGLEPAALAMFRDMVWWLHVFVFFGFFIYIPNSKHLHVLAAPFNGYFASLQPAGAQIPTFDPLAEEVDEYGVGRIEAFTWKQLLDSFACGECGRCMDSCPANLSGKPLNPKKLICRTLKEHLLEKGAVLLRHGLQSTKDLTPERLTELTRLDPEAEVLGRRLVGDVVDPEALWACATCGSCQNLCPVANEHVQKIIDMRRFAVMNEDNYAPELRLAFRNVESKFNPWGVSWSERGAWGKPLAVPLWKEATEPEYLFWVGCAGSFDNSAKKVSEAVAKILETAGVSFAILGPEEKCCGDFVRRAGNEYLFRLMAEENVAMLNQRQARRIVTACPHCLNTLKNEYPAFGGNFEVVHHTQLIWRLVQEGRLQIPAGAAPASPQRVVVHDSCYLGRYQGEYEAPRALFRLIPGLELCEMERHRDRSFCCGAGGARMWLEEDADERVNLLRARQALDKAPQAIGVNCPYCLTMMEDGVKDLAPDQGVEVVDPAVLIARLL